MRPIRGMLAPQRPVHPLHGPAGVQEIADRQPPRGLGVDSAESRQGGTKGADAWSADRWFAPRFPGGSSRRTVIVQSTASPPSGMTTEDAVKLIPCRRASTVTLQMRRNNQAALMCPSPARGTQLHAV